jgi:hypothetical protein
MINDNLCRSSWAHLRKQHSTCAIQIKTTEDEQCCQNFITFQSPLVVCSTRTSRFTNGYLEHKLFVSQGSSPLELKWCKGDVFSVFNQNSSILVGITCMCFVACVLQHFLASYVLGQGRRWVYLSAEVPELCFHTCVAAERERGTCSVSAASCMVAFLHDLISKPRLTSACEEYA